MQQSGDSLCQPGLFLGGRGHVPAGNRSQTAGCHDVQQSWDMGIRLPQAKQPYNIDSQRGPSSERGLHDRDKNSNDLD